MKLVRIVFFYALFFIIALVFSAILFEPGAEGMLVPFWFIAPGFLVWWLEKRRAGRLAAVAEVESGVADQGTKRRSSAATPVTSREREQIRPAAAAKPLGARASFQKMQALNSAEVDRVKRQAVGKVVQPRVVARQATPNPSIASSVTTPHAHGWDQPRIPIDAPSVRAPDNIRNWQQLDMATVVKRNREAALKSEGMAAERTAQTHRAAPSAIVQTGIVDRSKTQPQKNSNRQQGWVPKGQMITVSGRELSGFVYVGPPPTINKFGYGEKCRAYIDPSLAVAREGNDKAGTGMPYWPGYSSIPPECRATFLDWLAEGATDGAYNAGYMFLYFYGLERRFFVDDPAIAEKQLLLAEVRRLRNVFAENHSARRYLTAFIEFAVVATTQVEAIRPVFENPAWEMPLSVKVAIGARLQRGENLDADWVLSWFLCHPERSLRTSAKRCRDEFIALFRLRFDERFPQGLKVTKPRPILKASYQAASGEFEGTANPTIEGKPILDISGLRKPVEIAQEIADAVMEDLEKFSRYLGRNPNGRGSVEAHALLPQDLRRLFPSEELEKIRAWAVGVVEAGGLVPVGDVLERLEGGRPEKPGKRQLTGSADALARIGFGFAPDPRFALRSPTIEEPVVLFDLGGSIEQLEDVSTAYQAALMELALATFVAHADGVISEPERTALEAQAGAVRGLTDHELRRLRANLAWYSAVPPDMTLLRRKLKEIGPDQQSAIRAALVAAAHADGIVQPEEVAGIEKVYRALGLDPNLVYSDLHAGEVPDAPVRVQVARPGAPGEAIPAEPRTPGQKLDAARIAAIRQDTDRVSAVLADIFTMDTLEAEDEETTQPTALAGLDEKHTALMREIITRPHWTEQDFAELAGRHGLMVAGALETVNEWAFGAYDESLLEEYDGYDVSSDIAEALADAFERES